MQVAVYQNKKFRNRFLLVKQGYLDNLPATLLSDYKISKPFKSFNLSADDKRVALDSKAAFEEINRAGFHINEIKIDIKEYAVGGGV